MQAAGPIAPPPEFSGCPQLRARAGCYAPMDLPV